MNREFVMSFMLIDRLRVDFIFDTKEIDFYHMDYGSLKQLLSEVMLVFMRYDQCRSDYWSCQWPSTSSVKLSRNSCWRIRVKKAKLKQKLVLSEQIPGFVAVFPNYSPVSILPRREEGNMNNVHYTLRESKT